MLLLTVFRVWLVVGWPNYFIAGPHDDLFFVRSADFLLSGQWYGPYDQFTLIKAPFYGFFLVANEIIGLPLPVTETLFYIASVFALTYAIRSLFKSRWLLGAFFTFQLFIPESLSTEIVLRVYRDFVQISLANFLFASFIMLMNSFRKGSKWNLPLALFAGLSILFYLLNREESFWIYPILFFVLAYLLALMKGLSAAEKRVNSLGLLIILLVVVIPYQVLLSLNEFHYGFRGMSEQLDPNKAKLINVASELTEEKRPYNNISLEAFDKLARYSPKMDKLIRSIEILWEPWRKVDYNGVDPDFKPTWYTRKYPPPDDGLSAVYTAWMLDDAITLAGWRSEGRYPDDEMGQLIIEIEDVCLNGDLTCGKISSIPLLNSISFSELDDWIRMYFDHTRVISFSHEDFSTEPLDLLEEEVIYDPSFVLFEQFSNTYPRYQNAPDPEGYDAALISNKREIASGINSAYPYLAIAIHLLAIYSGLVIIFNRRMLSMSGKIPLGMSLSFLLLAYLARASMMVLLDLYSISPSMHHLGDNISIYYTIMFILIGSVIDPKARRWKLPL